MAVTLQYEHENEVTPWNYGEQLHGPPERKSEMLCNHSTERGQRLLDNDDDDVDADGVALKCIQKLEGILKLLSKRMP